MADKHTPHSLSNWINYMTHAEIDLLEQLVYMLPPASKPQAINIGAGVGTSALTLLSARDKLKVTTIDVQWEISPYGGLGNERDILEASGIDLEGRYDQIHSPSIEAGQAWAGGPVHLVFVDGDHSYEGCYGDCQTWWEHLVVGGIMAVHDYRKEAAYTARHGLKKAALTPALVRSVIKPYPAVDAATDDFIKAVEATLLGRMDSLIAFRKEK